MFSFMGSACSSENTPNLENVPEPPDTQAHLQTNAATESNRQTLVLGGGCFWCVEGVFEQLHGVVDVESGYAGGSKETANYQAVSSGQTEHAEVVRIIYDSSQITLGQLLKVFFTVAHDPTQLNRQGPDVGKQYRSVVFYVSENEKQIAQTYIHQLNKAGVFSRPIVTTLEPLEDYYPAEVYHQDYVKNNPATGYVQFQAIPKIRKLEQTYPNKIRKN